MAKKTAVIVCSNAGLDYLDYPKDIRIFRSVIHFPNDDNVYEDYVGMTAEAFYDRIAKKPDDVPKTSYVSVGTMIETFEELEKEGYEAALVITISAQLSGLFEAVRRTAASEDVSLDVTVFDSKTLAYAEAFMALEAHRMFDEGKSMEEVIDRLSLIRDNNKVYFAVDTLLYLVKNGRLSKFSGAAGTFLKLKPLLTLDDVGKVQSIEKIRTTPRARQRVLETYFNETEGMDVITYIAHAHAGDVAEQTKAKILEVYPDRRVETVFLTPVVGAHTGPKAIGVGYIKA
jgi:DegV family protein with EDD domain